MLDAFIIEEIKRRERELERRHDDNRPRQELPLPQAPSRKDRDEEPVSDRGVAIIDYSIENYGFGT